MRISDWSSDVCSSDLIDVAAADAATKIVEVPTGLTDTDGDGVVDSADKCPDTAAGSRVDGDGCPFDKVINLKGVTFELNKKRLRPDAQTILDWPRSEESRVGKEWVRRCRSWWWGAY